MSLTFPRDMTTAHRWHMAALDLVYRQEISRTAGGAVQGKDLGPALWVAEYETVPLDLADADALHADFASLGGVVRSFYLHPPRRPRPASFTGPDPSVFDTVAVSSVAAGRDTLALKNLPANFELTAGDFLSIDTGTGLELHRLAEGGQANGSGVTPQIAVVPHVRAAVAADDAVTLIDPLAEMRLEPDSLTLRQASVRTARLGFRAVQVLR